MFSDPVNNSRVKVLFSLLSYIAGFFIVGLIVSAIDTAALLLVPILYRLKGIVLSVVFLVSALSPYLGLTAFSWLASVTSLHLSCAMIALIVIVEYSNDSAQYRAARALALLTGDNIPEKLLDVTIAQAKAIGHAHGFAAAALAYVRGSAAF